MTTLSPNILSKDLNTPLTQFPCLYPSAKPESRVSFPAFEVVPSFVEPSRDRSRPNTVIRSAHHHTSFILCDFALPSLDLFNEGNLAFASRLQLRVTEGWLFTACIKPPLLLCNLSSTTYSINWTPICLHNLLKQSATMVRRTFV